MNSMSEVIDLTLDDNGAAAGESTDSEFEFDQPTQLAQRFDDSDDSIAATQLLTSTCNNFLEDEDDAVLLSAAEELETTHSNSLTQDIGFSNSSGVAVASSSFSDIQTQMIPRPILNSGSRSSLSSSRSSVMTQIGRFKGNIVNSATTGEFDHIYPHTKSLMKAFHNTFGHTDFRPIQLAAINASLLNHDCFIMMPTGGGKSLIYELVAVMLPGITVVVSPLISLIIDQIYHLRAYNISAEHLCGDISQESQARIFNDLESGNSNIKLLYVTPEKLTTSQRLRQALTILYNKNRLSAFAIDEVHCVSTWGHDFRPDYTKLSFLKNAFPQVRILALTATATPRVRNDIASILQLNSPRWFMSSFNRPNLIYEVRKVSKYSAFGTLYGILVREEFRGKTGIVYCLAKPDCDEIAGELRQRGIKAKSYHAGLPLPERETVQKSWTLGEIEIVCATIAFGMGIDKADVRFVIHMALPMSIESYYQQSGRAGRDGSPATCILLFNYNDIVRNRMLLNRGQGSDAAKKVRLESLKLMALYCENNNECRRLQQLEYFGEIFNSDVCRRNLLTVCDNCKRNPSAQVDLTEESKKIILALRQLSLSGTQCRFETFALNYSIAGNSVVRLDKLDLVKLMRILIAQDFLKETYIDVVSIFGQEEGYSVIEVGPNAELIEIGLEKIQMGVLTTKFISNPSLTVSSNANSRRRSMQDRLLENSRQCYIELKEYCAQVKETLTINSNCVMELWVLKEMCMQMPITSDHMMRLPGVTPANFQAYGPQLLKIITPFYQIKCSLQ